VNFGETNPLSPFLYLLALHYLISSSYCASASIYLVVCALCVGVSLLCSTLPTEVIHQVSFELEVEKGKKELFGVLTAPGGLTALSRRFNRLCLADRFEVKF
jgi:hypothetical protein